MTKNRILIFTDLSNNSLIVLQKAINFASLFDYNIFLIHLISETNFSQHNDEIINEVQRKIENQIQNCKNPSLVSIHHRIEFGKFTQKICVIEKELNPSYIFLTFDNIFFEDSFSTIVKLVENIDCPLFIFNEHSSNKQYFENIVLPLDLTKETQQKIDLTIDIALANKSTVHIISVTDFLDELECDKLKGQLEQVKQLFEKKNINAVTKLIKSKDDIGLMASAINAFAVEINADLVVIMTRQETKLQKFFVGSMALKLLYSAEVPILCIRPKTI